MAGAERIAHNRLAGQTAGTATGQFGVPSKRDLQAGLLFWLASQPT